MAQFPRGFSKIQELANQMMAGIASHADIFSSCDAQALSQSLETFDSDSIAVAQAQAVLKNAAEKKRKSLLTLTNLMKDQIRLARVDTATQPANMEYIGIRGRKQAASIAPPPSPGKLSVDVNGSVKLEWEKSQYDPHRPVRIYMVQKRDYSCKEEYLKGWQLEGVSFENSFRLETNDKDKKYQYRVVASNDAGSSLESNTVCV